jgi:hypothetical protein
MDQRRRGRERRKEKNIRGSRRERKLCSIVCAAKPNCGMAPWLENGMTLPKPKYRHTAGRPHTNSQPIAMTQVHSTHPRPYRRQPQVAALFAYPSV